MGHLAGTLKAEIDKPESDSWEHVASRMFAMRDTIGPALNLTMRDLYVEAVDMLDAYDRRAPDARKLADALGKKVERLLKLKWNSQLEAARVEGSTARARIRARSKGKQPPDDAFDDVQEYWSAETRHNVASRFTGEHLKDLLARRASFPSWHSSAAFFARSRACSVEGPPSNAVLTLPLWGAGRKATRVVVAPCGDSDKNRWRKLVAGELKLGRVGVKYDENRRKWYALISWTGETVAEAKGPLVAAAHIGVTRFVQIATSDGDFHDWSGEDIVIMRQRLAHRRESIQRCLNTMGTGSKGHGVKRRERPITRLGDAESRFVTTKIRQIAHDIVSWCLRQIVGTLYWPDMTGARDDFERKTGGEAHEEVKRFIHTFPFFELHQAVLRDGKERGVAVKLHSVEYDSQTCPVCGHVSKDNLREVAQRAEVIEYHGRRFVRNETAHRFKCEQCEHRDARDKVAVVNALQRLGCKDAMTKLDAKLRSISKQKLNKIVNSRRPIAGPACEASPHEVVSGEPPRVRSRKAVLSKLELKHREKS